MCLEALGFAIDRWEGATALATDAAISERALRFATIGEALFWASCLDEATANLRDRPDREESQLLDGLRYARNRITHDLVQTTVEHPDAVLPIRLPARLAHYRWQDADKIPPPERGLGSGDARGRRSGYVAAWQGQHVDQTLQALLSHFQQLQ